MKVVQATAYELIRQPAAGRASAHQWGLMGAEEQVLAHDAACHADEGAGKGDDGDHLQEMFVSVCLPGPKPGCTTDRQLCLLCPIKCDCL